MRAVLDAVKTVSEFRTLLAEMTALLQECRDLLRQIRDDQRETLTPSKGPSYDH